jgi:hypothetical protein
VSGNPFASGRFRLGVRPALYDNSLDPQALLKGDRQRLRAVIDLDCATPEHAAFVKKLADARNTT